MEVGKSEKKRLDAPCALAKERPTCLFPTSDAPLSFSYFLPQEEVDSSSQMYIGKSVQRVLTPFVRFFIL
ncbi:hypothetical protein HMPREF0083_03470 [Aneurinibacillus aneurinilyticus ATCC 12856]|uniref:Uncharacterized protein n=1 Tax=Aneurinibacillus aneurinilyticus ATCC 12856 TaxID=649747 RepID=U1X1P6_ANEAE|nr:hypothetical protein HMPREF0083_03470 [Aneurinibacillus aneurinilyticus ATCC 12856]